ncbi:hypothetical protein E1B28_002635 [Marasmius oreades]|nr:uncharacterized protein E1B28_002635 [Marasmius oreades]KAG7086697.1 hypothetical protein E1B28_002635 [Marasmius oreades]
MARINTMIAECYESKLDVQNADANCLGQMMAFVTAQADTRKKQLQLNKIPIMVVTSDRRPPVLDKIANNFRLGGWTAYNQFPVPESLRLCVSRRTITIARDIVKFIHSAHHGEHGLVFCQRRKIGDMILTQLGNSARYVHTDSNREDTEKALLEWHSGKIKVLILTNELGLSTIYKAETRFLIHGEPPEDLETYYHHACLAGGDGKPADAILYYSCSDLKDHSSGRIATARHRQHVLQSYCRNKSHCRRVGLLQAVGKLEAYTKKCNLCDACDQGYKFVERDLTKEARKAAELIRELDSKDKTLRYCQEVFAGKCTAQVRKNGVHESVHFGAGSHLPFDCIEQLFEELYLMDIWKHFQDVDDWDNLIVKPGSAVLRTQDKSFRLTMKVRDNPQLSRRGTPPSTLPLYRDDSDSAESSFTEEGALLDKEAAGDGKDCPMEVFSAMKALRLQLQIELGLAGPEEVLDDQTLQYLSVARPLDFREFKRIVKECSSLSMPEKQDKYAEEKWNRFGQRFLNVCIVARPPSHASE